MAKLDLLALGNAIVDVLAYTEEDFLIAQKLHKGGMTLIDEERAMELYALMGPATVVSGGSAANTVVGAASLGIRAGFIGKVREDEVGALYRHDMRAVGVHYETPAARDGPATARSFVLVTPDGERTMNTYLGISQRLGPDDVDPALVEGAAITYLEGYLWDPPAAKQAFLKAVEIAHAKGNRVSLTLSDAFCVDRYRDEFLGMIRGGQVDILFANIHELQSLYQTGSADAAIAALREEALSREDFVAVVTRSADGALVATRSGMEAIAAHPVEKVVDTTGAGDLFAAGFLTGLVRDLSLGDCARLGGLCAAEVIGHLGARPQKNLRQLAVESGLLT